MKIGTMIGDITKSLFQRPATRRYPFEKQAPPPRLRGRVVWDKEKCTGCSLCVKDCPSFALELFVIDRKAKQWVMRYHVDRCTFCAQCVESCRFDSIKLSDEEWELAALTPASFDVYYGDDAHVQSILAKQAAGSAGQSE